MVIATRNRAAELGRTLDRFAALPDRPPLVVVDNASSDATATLVRERHPWVELVTAPRNLGIAARTLGARLARTPYVAFSDDDSWWAPGALGRAAVLLDAHPRLALVAARTVVGAHEWPDPVDWSMERSPLTSSRPLPGPPVLGFLACASVVRRTALLDVGGFAPFLVVGAEERLLAYDLRAAGWDLTYVDGVVAHHHPSRVRDALGRRSLTAPCSRRLIALVRGLAERRAAEADPHRSVVCHGDPHAANALTVLAPRPGAASGYVFVDPDGFLGDPAYDLAVAMRGWPQEVLSAGDPVALTRTWSARLAAATDVDEQRIWEWALIERVTTGLYLTRHGHQAEGRMYLDSAERLVPH